MSAGQRRHWVEASGVGQFTHFLPGLVIGGESLLALVRGFLQLGRSSLIVGFVLLVLLVDLVVAVLDPVVVLAIVILDVVAVVVVAVVVVVVEGEAVVLEAACTAAG